jgi:hypothetical protein
MAKSNKNNHNKNSSHTPDVRQLETNLIDLQLRQFSKTQLTAIDKIINHLNPFKASLASVEKVGDKIVLFTGNNVGTKIIATKKIASTLKLPLYRIDLSVEDEELVGETEKHIDAIFESLDGTDAILFFDEANALFGGPEDEEEEKYSKEDTEYFLQKIASYPCVAVVVTNYGPDDLGEHNVPAQTTMELKRPFRPIKYAVEPK